MLGRLIVALLVVVALADDPKTVSITGPAPVGAISFVTVVKTANSDDYDGDTLFCGAGIGRGADSANVPFFAAKTTKNHAAMVINVDVDEGEALNADDCVATKTAYFTTAGMEPDDNAAGAVSIATIVNKASDLTVENTDYEILATDKLLAFQVGPDDAQFYKKDDTLVFACHKDNDPLAAGGGGSLNGNLAFVGVVLKTGAKANGNIYITVAPVVPGTTTPVTLPTDGVTCTADEFKSVVVYSPSKTAVTFKKVGTLVASGKGPIAATSMAAVERDVDAKTIADVEVEAEESNNDDFSNFAWFYCGTGPDDNKYDKDGNHVLFQAKVVPSGNDDKKYTISEFGGSADNKLSILGCGAGNLFMGQSPGADFKSIGTISKEACGAAKDLAICKEGTVYDSSKAETKCAALKCDFGDDKADSDTCCGTQQTCAEANAAEIAMCTSGFVYDTEKAETKCAGVACATGDDDAAKTDSEKCCIEAPAGSAAGDTASLLAGVAAFAAALI